MILHTCEKLAGILVLSGYLAQASKFCLSPGFEDVPVLHCHGIDDPMVRHDWAVKTKEHIEGRGHRRYEQRSIRGLGHSVNYEVIQAATAFLAQVLPDEPSLAVQPKAPSDMSVKELKAAIRNAGLAAKAIGFSEKFEFVKLLEDHYTSSSSS